MATHSAPRSSVRKKPQFKFPKSSKVRIGLVAALLAIIAGITVVLVGGGGSGSGPTVAVPAVSKTDCPLTDTPAPGNKVPDRPAIAIKIGNEPGPSRPQSGLNEADVVFDTPAEGFVMRYVAVYQCQLAPTIGPIRSVRWVDWHITPMLGHPILAFAGGIDPDVAMVDAQTDLTPANLLEGQQAAGHRTTDRTPPDNLYTSSAAIYALFPTLKGAPKPIFSYSTTVPKGGTKIKVLKINYSAGTDIDWKWSSSLNQWVHAYSGVVDIDATTNKPVTTTNVAVISAKYTLGPNIESPGGSGDVESQIVGSGPGYVLRNGEEINVTWSRAVASDPMIFKDSSGNVVSMAPGRTWVEIVPNTVFSSELTFVRVK
jgi:hypothetical protein